jgi:hypothetical protein
LYAQNLVNMKKTFAAYCAATKEHYTFRAVDLLDAKHWVINHLDCSKQWEVYSIDNTREKAIVDSNTIALDY